MTRSRSYYALIASLPRLPSPFEAERVPITPLRLEQRLRMLAPEDAEIVKRMQEFLVWDRQREDRTDQEVIAHYQRLMAAMTNRLVRHLIAFRMDIRTIVSGLRRRRQGLPPPSGVGRWVRHLQRHWTRPEFNLGRRFAWIRDIERLAAQGDALEAERRVLTVTWDHWSRLAAQYQFSFEAVVLYLARWEIVHRWTRLNAEVGRERLEQLVGETLGEHARLFE